MDGQGLRRSILSLLLEVFPESISGERIAASCSVSRVAVWKEIQRLREDGFPVIPSRAGYRLASLPDRFDSEFLEAYLREIPGVQVIFKEEIDSTNTFLRAHVGDFPEGTLCIAERQLQGRGRRGRSWFSLERKSLAFSLLLRPSLSLEACPAVTLLAGLALARALEGLGFSPGLKWPNDVLLREKKVAGILLETSTDLDVVPWAVLGVGVNVNLTEDDLSSLPFVATSLFVEKGAPVLRVSVLRHFLSYFFESYRKWKESGDFTPWVSEYNCRFIFSGKHVTVAGGKEPVSGIARRVDARGALWIEKDGKELAITWGEIV